VQHRRFAEILASARQMAVGNSVTSYKLPDLDPNLEVSEFTVEFDVRIFGSAAPADGFSAEFRCAPIR
jgi:hypothetical protein